MYNAFRSLFDIRSPMQTTVTQILESPNFKPKPTISSKINQEASKLNYRKSEYMRISWNNPASEKFEMIKKALSVVQG